MFGVRYLAPCLAFTCLFLTAVTVLLALAMFIRQRNVKKYKSLKDQLQVMDTLGNDAQDGASERDNASFDYSTLRVEDKPLGACSAVWRVSFASRIRNVPLIAFVCRGGVMSPVMSISCLYFGGVWKREVNSGPPGL